MVLIAGTTTLITARCWRFAIFATSPTDARSSTASAGAASRSSREVTAMATTRPGSSTSATARYRSNDCQVRPPQPPSYLHDSATSTTQLPPRLSHLNYPATSKTQLPSYMYLRHPATSTTPLPQPPSYFTIWWF